MTAEFEPSGAHLVGSVPLASSDDVFRAVAAVLGDRVRSIPDGETGRRSKWVGWQLAVFAANPQLAEEPAAPDEAVKPKHTRYVLADGVEPGALRFGELGFAREALASYERFAALADDGAIPPHVRFRVCLPTPAAPVELFCAPSARAAVAPAYEAALLDELARIAAAIPHERLAIQWDAAVEFGWIEGVLASWAGDDPLAAAVERMARVTAAVPEAIPVGHHLCYGDFDHRHFVEPTDAANLVAVANGVHAAVGRSIEFLHLPVPRERDDAAYHAPLARLALHPETELYLGLLHLTDGVAGARRRIAAAAAVLERFGVATECGFGRRSPNTVSDLLRLHRELASPVTAA